MIFAAGFGTRMRPLTDHMPKPMIPVAGKPLIDHAADPAIAAGLSPIVVNAHYKAEQVVNHFAGSGVDVVVEPPQILETGGGLKAVATRFGPDVATMNSDAVWSGPNPFEALLDAWDTAQMDALLLCVPLARALGRAGRSDFALGPSGQLTRGDGWVYTGAQIIRRDLVQAYDEDIFSLNVIWDQAATRGRLFGVEYSGRWCDVGQPEAIGLAEGMQDV